MTHSTIDSVSSSSLCTMVVFLWTQAGGNADDIIRVRIKDQILQIKTSRFLDEVSMLALTDQLMHHNFHHNSVAPPYTSIAWSVGTCCSNACHGCLNPNS